MKVRLITEVSIWEYCVENARAVASFNIFLERIKNRD
jgi:hypothetical protein